jgi:hypothetical protein
LEARDLVERTLERDPKKRISAKEALEHPWIATRAPPTATVLEALCHLEEYGVDEEVDEDSYAHTFHALVRMWNPSPQAIKMAEVICSRLPHLVATVHNGETPLHMCVSARKAWNRATQKYDFYRPSPQMALTLIRASPEVCTVGAWSVTGSLWNTIILKTPLHLACEANADIMVLKAMLQVDPTLASQMMGHFTREENMGQYTREQKSPADLLWAAAANETSLDKMALLLLTQLEGRVVDPLPMHHLLHAACYGKCPWEYFDRIWEEYSAQASQIDDRGNFPLHYAVQNSSLLFQCTDPSVFHGGPRVVDGTSILSLRRHRRLGQHSVSGTLKWNTGIIEKVMAANPEALYALDGETGLPPALLAATKSGTSRHHLSVTFDLLLAAPDLVLGALANTTDGQGTGVNHFFTTPKCAPQHAPRTVDGRRWSSRLMSLLHAFYTCFRRPSTAITGRRRNGRREKLANV